MNLIDSSQERPLPKTRVACFCDQVIQGSDGVMTIVRIIDRVELNLTQPLPPETANNSTSLSHSVTFFTLLDEVQDWFGHSFELWGRAPSAGFEKQGELLFSEAKFPMGSLSLTFRAELNLYYPGNYEFEVRVQNRSIVTRSLQLIVLPPDIGRSGPGQQRL